MRADLSRRSDEPEWMDDPATGWETFRGCLRDLARVNVLSLGYRPTLGFLETLRAEGRLPVGRPVEILDVGSGYGDTLRAVDAWTDRHGIAARLTGLDLSPWSTRAASEVTKAGRPIEYRTGDVFAHESEADIILSSLFAHHLDDAGIVRFLRWMEAHSRIGWFINDLHRHALPHAAFGTLAGILQLHPFVRNDGPVSFRRAFRPEDWGCYLREGGIGGPWIRRYFPFRLCVARIKYG